jgi:sn-glycerol 3-phosphate transport system permease protein
MTIPDELLEAARVDGAGPWRFFKDIAVPLSLTNVAAIFRHPVHLWLEPVSVAAADHHATNMNTIVIGIKKMISFADALTEWQPRHGTACWRCCRRSWWSC